MDENHRIRKITTTFSNDRNLHANNLLVDADYHFQSSLVEQTIPGNFSPGITRVD